MPATYPDLPARYANTPYEPIHEDPLDPDLPTDRMILTSRRALCRVVTVAAEAGARFQREGASIDPVGWMLAPRRMFDGAAALEACLEKQHFIKAVMLHGLSLGTDADPDLFDRIIEDDPSTMTPEGAVTQRTDAVGSSRRRMRNPSRGGALPPRRKAQKEPRGRRMPTDFVTAF
ncbi:hypothetical protein [Novosphingobium rosa]|uniref:hypothetical protein n=1 Tax=Novosphingobium rosa TaxID=76978 RepID=UPI000A438C6F|nr:hypothetical protein [Novosphingobium rosa]